MSPREDCRVICSRLLSRTSPREHGSVVVLPRRLAMADLNEMSLLASLVEAERRGDGAAAGVEGMG